MDVAGYIRVSTEQQKQDGSHENQRDQLREWADRNGHTIELFEDIAISGQSDERPGYADMMDRAGEFDAIVVRELSRFGRNLRKVLDDVESLDDQGVEFITLSGEFDTSTAQGKMHSAKSTGAFRVSRTCVGYAIMKSSGWNFTMRRISTTSGYTSAATVITEYTTNAASTTTSSRRSLAR